MDCTCNHGILSSSSYLAPSVAPGTLSPVSATSAAAAAVASIVCCFALDGGVLAMLVLAQPSVEALNSHVY